MSKTARDFTVCFTMVLVLLTMVPHISHSQTMTIAPHRIILNAEGNTDTIQAIISMTLESGYVTVTDHDISLSFNGIFIAKAVSARYCPIDDNLLISFDRDEIKTNPDVVEMAGTTVQATVNGSFSISNGTDTLTKEVSGVDTVEIIKPGKK